MQLLDELEQAVEALLQASSADHVVNGSAVVCYLGRERRELDSALMQYRSLRTFAGQLEQLTAPVPDGQVTIDAITYIVDTVAVYGEVFTAAVYRRQ